MNVKPFFLVTAFCCSLTFGCRDRQQVDLSDIRPLETESDHLQQALVIVDDLDSSDFGNATTTSVFNFNLWIKLHEDDPQWVTPSLINTLPASVSNTGFVQSIGGKRFIPLDINYLHETSWLRAISQWVAAGDQPHRLFWEGYKPEMESEADGEKLSVALKLFDWTVRNIQLEALLDYPTLPVASETEDKTAPQLALPGPGYNRTNRDVLTLGRGDWWQRSRIFSLLARQLNLDVVVLGLPAKFGESNLPWLTAVMIGDELYLFDLSKGLPVLDPENHKIATLNQLRANVAFSQTILPVSHQQDATQTMSQLVGLIEADVVAVSHRMAILEKYLTGDRQMVLSVAPNVISRTLRTRHNITRSVIWVPIYEGYLFEAALSEKIRNNDASAREFLKAHRDHSVFHDVPQLREGRYKLFRGIFDDPDSAESSDGQHGAKTLMMASRLPQKNIEGLLTDEQVQKAYGMVRPETVPVSLWRDSLVAKQRTFVTAKDYASFYIAMIHMEEGQYRDAIEWFERRTLQSSLQEDSSDGSEIPAPRETNAPQVPDNASKPAEPIIDIGDILSGNSLTAGPSDATKLLKSAYHDLAVYNLARCYYALGEKDRAIELLTNTQSQQRVGDQQLLQWIKMQMP